MRKYEQNCHLSEYGQSPSLSNLDPHDFEFSVLEISPSTMSADDVIARENWWKECLGTREFGLNSNKLRFEFVDFI